MTTNINIHKLISSFVVIVFSALLISCATSPESTILLTGKARTPIDIQSVKVLPVVPQHAEMIGIITSSGIGGLGHQDKLNSALKELKRQAALLGSNAIVLEEMTDSAQEQSNQPNKGINISINLRSVTLKAKALFQKQ